MLEIKPIQSKEEQEAACVRCGVPYQADMMAYSAKDDGKFIGVAQFTMIEGAGYINNITLTEGTDDFEALFLLGRAMLNFIDLCGIHQAYCAEDAAEGRILTAIGFRRDAENKLHADMTHMFGGCGGDHK
jgi:hypothetical protein